MSPAVIDRTVDATVALAVMQVEIAGLNLKTAANALLFAQERLSDSVDKAEIGKALVFLERAQNALNERFNAD